MTGSCPIYIRKLSCRLPVHFKARLFSCRTAEYFSRPTVNLGGVLLGGSAWEKSCWGFHQGFPCALCTSPSRSLTFKFVFSLKAKPAWHNPDPHHLTLNTSDTPRPFWWGTSFPFWSENIFRLSLGFILYFILVSISKRPFHSIPSCKSLENGFLVQGTEPVLVHVQLSSEWLILVLMMSPEQPQENEIKLAKTPFAPSCHIFFFLPGFHVCCCCEHQINQLQLKNKEKEKN